LSWFLCAFLLNSFIIPDTVILFPSSEYRLSCVTWLLIHEVTTVDAYTLPSCPASPSNLLKQVNNCFFKKLIRISFVLWTIHSNTVENSHK
jgi:hypothetical protein